jgi:hypothetical protein
MVNGKRRRDRSSDGTVADRKVGRNRDFIGLPRTAYICDRAIPRQVVAVTICFSRAPGFGELCWT